MKDIIKFATIVSSLCVLFQTGALADDKDGGKKSATGEAAVDESLHSDIRKMLKLSGQGELGIQAMKQILGSFKQAMPQVPDEFWDEFMKEAKADDLIDMVVPIYAKHFTRDDIGEMIKFYNSPVGKKLIKKQPKIMKESMAAGEIWGGQISEKLLQRLREKGYQA